ncbi:methyltransferase domain-containing protein [Shewanella canadensis]|uniref:Methyltransferase domain-containing protein n=1 Tax=Shewanella canadensis TaxID=271096 RepID=A0A3S0IP87_9GAMM|nr:methyltransferase domain-containing protein [Shewanella canadensis]RTR38849.1 methyltransferase domain-containing protein [Shewanella canadensis]
MFRRRVTQGQDACVPQHKIIAVYDKLAPVYDIWGALTETNARNRALELANVGDGSAVLEVAVGTGLTFSELVKQNLNGTNIGVDISPGMLEKAKARLKKVENATYLLETGNAFNLNVESHSIDILMNNYMFDLIAFKDMPIILNEFKRVLKHDGRLILVNMTQGESRLSRVYELVYRISPKLMGGCRGVTLTDELIASGFKVETREYIQQMLFPSEVILARPKPRAPLE